MATQGHPFGHHFLIGLQPSPELTEHDRRLLETLRPAGVILFRPNFDHEAPYEAWLTTLRRLLGEVRECIGRERVVVAIDHEGGRVLRAPPPVTAFAYAREWADEAGEVARAMAVELRSLGVNLTFAPVMDIHSNPDNPVIGPRAFATDADAVTRAGLAFIEGVEEEGVAACPKHFPGHGDTAVDSHKGLPVVEYTLDELRARELKPFAAAVEAGVGMVMTSHILFPKIDPGTPATMSHAIISGVLRGELGFDGVVVTDDIGMGAVSAMFNRREAAESMMNAGTDLISICAFGTDTGRAVAIADNIAAGFEEGRINRRALETSAARIATFLASLPQHDVEQLPLETFEAHARIAPLHHAATTGTGTWKKS